MRLLRLAVAFSAIGAMLALCLLPAQHLHSSDAGPAVVHRHTGEHIAGHAAPALDDDHDHGHAVSEGHNAVTTLDPSYASRPQFHIVRPLIAVAVVLVAPEPRRVARFEPTDDPVTHAPPIRPRSLRAPPA